MKLMQFLMGLDDSYMQIGNSILFREVLPDVRSSYANIYSEDSLKIVASSSSFGPLNGLRLLLLFLMPIIEAISRGIKPLFNGQTTGICFKLIGHPTDFGKKKVGQNFKGKFVSNNNSVEPSSSTGFTDEQLNLILSNGLTLFDVLVIPEYYVTLVYVHKLAKDNKKFIAFDEGTCFFNQDLNLKNVMRIDNQCGGSYYFNDQDPVLNVLTHSLQINSKDQNNFYEICQRAKQTRESFPSSDHTSSDLGDLLNKSCEPKSFLKASKHTHWTDVMNAEMEALLRNDTWEITNFPKDRKAIEGFNQKECIDYEETFSTVVKMVTIRCLLNLDVQSNCQSRSDYSLYTKNVKGVFIALLVYVDDIIITGNSVVEIEKFKEFLKTNFMIKDLGKLKYFLGIEVIDTKDGICLNQRKYCLELSFEFGMLVCKHSSVPLPSKLVISNEPTSDDHLIILLNIRSL
ncbi:ribonuclease H-like domain-containing protein [Tanacetum coccineum]|uniref:Ribonuclease H-like domain-containing protein n=1 Tax=Tanacetum coccineum TaxID=301880 RepID=A0ABQ5JCX5_9ASTR